MNLMELLAMELTVLVTAAFPLFVIWDALKLSKKQERKGYDSNKRK